MKEPGGSVRERSPIRSQDCTQTRRRLTTVSPSKRHGRAVSEAAVAGKAVHAHGRLSAIARCQKKFLLHTPYRGLRFLGNESNDLVYGR